MSSQDASAAANFWQGTRTCASTKFFNTVSGSLHILLLAQVISPARPPPTSAHASSPHSTQFHRSSAQAAPASSHTVPPMRRSKPVSHGPSAPPWCSSSTPVSTPTRASSRPCRSDALLHDKAVHASVHDGAHVAGVAPRMRRPFTLNDVGVENVYSMDGTVVPLRAILDIMDEVFPAGNTHLIVAEAHATGLYAPGGRGIVALLGLEDSVHARLHTFGQGSRRQVVRASFTCQYELVPASFVASSIPAYIIAPPAYL